MTLQERLDHIFDTLQDIQDNYEDFLMLFDKWNGEKGEDEAYLDESLGQLIDTLRWVKNERWKIAHNEPFEEIGH